ncbi:MAG: HAMP domain-containing sensor histidine kinase [Hyphomicrobiaceae bacterium]|nr:HAMP domain-containing sensor histidine kinase [Hyphomicrobiaceae bacterium]
MLGENRDNEPRLSLIAEYALRAAGGEQAQGKPESAQGLRREAEMQLARANKLKADFISHMSHELRTPLNAMIGFSKLIKGHGSHPLSEAEIVSYADLINTAACRLLTFVNDVLELSKLQSGSYALTHEDLDVGDVLAGLVADVRQRAEREGVDVGLEADCDILVDGDAGKLRRALGNVIENAVRFTPKGGCVEITAARRAGEVQVVVRDTGVGMTQEEIALALAPFGISEIRKRADGARGLGLPLAHALVAAHGGSIEIASESGKGTEVRIRLPALADACSQAPHLNAASA